MKKILIFISLLLILPFVSAGFIGDTLNIFNGLDISYIYTEYQGIIDFFIYVLIFVGLARVVFEQKFQGSGGKAIIIGVGSALSFAMVYYANIIGFNLGEVGPFAFILLIALFGYTIYSLIRSLKEDSSYCAVAAAYILTYLMIKSVNPGFGDYIGELWAWLSLGFLIALIILIICIVRLFGGLGGDSGSRRESSRDEPEERDDSDRGSRRTDDFGRGDSESGGGPGRFPGGSGSSGAGESRVLARFITPGTNGQQYYLGQQINFWVDIIGVNSPFTCRFIVEGGDVEGTRVLRGFEVNENRVGININSSELGVGEYWVGFAVQDSEGNQFSTGINQGEYSHVPIWILASPGGSEEVPGGGVVGPRGVENGEPEEVPDSYGLPSTEEIAGEEPTKKKGWFKKMFSKKEEGEEEERVEEGDMVGKSADEREREALDTIERYMIKYKGPLVLFGTPLMIKEIKSRFGLSLREAGSVAGGNMDIFRKEKAREMGFDAQTAERLVSGEEAKETRESLEDPEAKKPGIGERIKGMFKGGESKEKPKGKKPPGLLGQLVNKAKKPKKRRTPKDKWEKRGDSWED